MVMAHAETIMDMCDNSLERIVNRMKGTKDGNVIAWTVTQVRRETGNFVTGGVFRIEGILAADGQSLPWSLIVKAISPDPVRNDPAHYNYWRREALIYQSGALDALPDGIHAPACYGVEENAGDGNVWLWQEDVDGGLSAEWGDDDYSFAAGELGRMQAAYLLEEEPLPAGPSVNMAWLSSWVQESRKFAAWRPDKAIAYARGAGMELVVEFVQRYDRLQSRYDGLIETVNRLPRTFAHQDFYRDNLFIDKSGAGRPVLRVIDWQFASVSGVGEDLGRFFGLTMSRGVVPVEGFREYRRLLLDGYLSGLRMAGWTGEERLATFGFLVACAVRSVWEVPKLIRGIEREHEEGSEPGIGGPSPAIERLSHVVDMQLCMAEEAIELQAMLQL